MTLPSTFHTALEPFERTGDLNAGIEAAATALQIGRHAESRSLAYRLVTVLERERIDQLPQRTLGIGGEAYVLIGDMEKARKWYEKAASICRTDHHSIAAMRRRARHHLETLGLDRAAVDDVLAVPRIAAFAGHMVDEPGRAIPRFPSEKVEAVRLALACRLRILKIGYGFCSAARGSDILFIEELKKIGGCPRVFLPFPRDAFKKTSVGYGWNERFDEALHDVEVVELSRTVPEEDGRPKAYAACSAAIRHEATAKATSLDDKPILIAVYNGNPGDGRGGTADAVREWNSQYDLLEIVEISTPGN
jgi:hypothetical protein